MKNIRIKRIFALLVAFAAAAALTACGGGSGKTDETTADNSINAEVTTDAPATDAPATDAPATDAPETDAPIVLATWEDAMQYSLDRSTWSATASHNGDEATISRAFDDDIETRWDTNAIQVPDMFFTLDLGSAQTFNYLLLDVGSSTDDGPADYEVYVSSDGENWGDCLAEGYKDDIIKLSSTQTAQYIKIVVTGSDANCYWSIHEMYVCNVPEN